jgi:hypothetical protein
MRTASVFVSLCFFTLAACAAPSSEPSEAPAAASDELVANAAPDATMLAGAKAFYEALMEQDEHRAESEIPYRELPSKLARELQRAYPNPKAEWAAEAFRTEILDSAGRRVVVFAVIDGIDDEGADITLYTKDGRKIAEGDDYRGFSWSL